MTLRVLVRGQSFKVTRPHTEPILATMMDMVAGRDLTPMPFVGEPMDVGDVLILCLDQSVAGR